MKGTNHKHKKNYTFLTHKIYNRIYPGILKIRIP